MIEEGMEYYFKQKLLKLKKIDNYLNDYNAQFCLWLDAIIANNIEFIKFLLSTKELDPSILHNKPFREAVQIGSFSKNTAIIELLIQDNRVNPSYLDNDCFCIAARNQCLNTMTLLLNDPRINPSDQKNYAAKFLIQHNVELFELIIPHILKFNTSELYYCLDFA